MGNAAMHFMTSEGKWRVTDAPDDWIDDGRMYPEAKASDKYFSDKADALKEYIARKMPSRVDEDSN